MTPKAPSLSNLPGIQTLDPQSGMSIVHVVNSVNVYLTSKQWFISDILLLTFFSVNSTYD